ncbi:MAG: hypothetical protein HY658_14765 [Actinobacteria bacterium]|nr:hypothetical protein [Actinomycetota bacterium]
MAWALWGASVALAVAALVLLYLGREAEPPAGSFGFRGFAAVFALVFSTVGVLIAARQQGNPIGWLLLTMGLFSGVQELGQEYAIYAILARATPLPGGAVGGWILSWIWVPLTSLATVFLFLLFPGGRLLSPRWRWAAGVGMAGVILASASLALSPGPLENFAVVDNPLAIGSSSLWGPLAGIGLTLYLAGVVGGATSLVVRFTRSRGDERQQIKWLAAAGVLVAAALFLSFVVEIPGVFRPDEGFPAWVENAVVLSFLAIPAATGIAVLKYRLYDIDLVVNRAVVYALLAALVTATYLAVVVGIGSLFGRGDRPNVALSILTTAVVAVAFQPVRTRVQHLANRLVYGKRATPYEVLAEFGRRMETAYTDEDAPLRMARALAEGTDAAHAAVWFQVSGRLRRVAVWPPEVASSAPEAATVSGDRVEVPGADLSLPVRHGGELLGALSVAKRPGDAIRPAEERLLKDLASQAGLVLRNARLTEELRARLEQILRQADELRASRQRIVAAQDAERRRIERDIHDGAQQHLVAMMVKLRLAETMAARDPDRTSRLLSELQSDMQGTLDELRDLARGIYPPLLADQGLRAALDAQLRKVPFPVRLDADGVGRFPQEAEAAVYFCCLEALQNVSKYARAEEVTIILRQDEHELRFSVEDDGVGFDPSTTPRGAGLQNIADRVAALGGSVEIRSAPGEGTSVSGQVPIPVEDGAPAN